MKKIFFSSILHNVSYVPTVPIFYECEIPDSHRNIFIVKTELLFVDLIDNLISNNFSCVKMDFRFRKKSEQLALMVIRKSVGKVLSNNRIKN